MKKLTLLLAAFLLAPGLFSQESGQGELVKRLEKHVAYLASDSLEGRGLGTNGKLLAKNYIDGQFRETGLLPFNGTDYFQEFNLKIGSIWVPGANVIGFLRGSDPGLQDEFIVVGAHYDHLGYQMKDHEKVVYHGADDNASGVAAVIELARYFAARPELVKRSLIFIAFDAEESGLLGSGKFIDEDTIFEVSTCRVMFSIDMVGMYAANKGLDLTGIGTVKEGESLAKSIADSTGFQLQKTTGSVEYATDTWPFAEKGIPAIHLFTGKESPYHKPEDTYDKLDYEGMAGIVIYMQSLISELSASRELGPSRQFEKTTNPCALRFNAGVTAGLGSSRHKYPGEFYNAKSIFAYNAGFFLQMNIGKRISLQPELLYQGDGSKSDEGNFRLQSLCIPLNLHYNIVNEYGGVYKVYPFAGGYFKYSFSGKNGGNELDFESEYNHRQWGMNLGLGLDMMKFQVKLYWQQSLSELSLNSSRDINLSAWFFTMGYKF